MRIKNILLLFFCLVTFVQCNDKDEYYDEPSWLEPPLYEVLQSKDRFSMYLECVDRTLYAPVIKAGGLYTLFAPNNDAFTAFLTEKGYASIADIPQEEADAIVGYSMVFSRWTYSHLGDIFNGTNEQQYLTGRAIKKRTNYYKTIYQDSDFDNAWVVDQNRIAGGYDREYFSYKYLPVLTAQHFIYAGLNESDYNTFFPDTPFSLDNIYNANVYDGQVINDSESETDADGMIARNGVAHEVSKVVLPLANMDKFLYEPQYALYKSLLDFKTLSGTYAYKNYTEDATLTEFFKKLYPEIGSNNVYVKSYNARQSDDLGSGELFFSPIYEQYDFSPTSTEMNGYTLFVPTESALSEYLDKTIYKYYDNLQEAPLEAIEALLNVHMGLRMYWPSNFSAAQTATGEYINGIGSSGDGYEGMNVVSQTMASNGFIYLIDRVIKSKWFETVYTRIFLDPDYSMLNRSYINHYASSLRLELMESIISDGIGSKKFTLLLPSDELLSADGYSKTIDDAGTEVLVNPSILSGSADDRIKRLIRMHVFQGYSADGIDTEITSFEGDGPSQYNGWGFRTTYYGDLIRFKDGMVQACGNVEDGTFAEVELLESFDNGSVYSMKGDMLQFSPRHSASGVEDGWKSKTMWQYLVDMKTEVTSTQNFVNYVENVLKENADSDDLTGINDENYYTVLAITSSSLNTAIANGITPPLDSLPTATDDASVAIRDRNLKRAQNFVYAHFLTGRVYADDGIIGYLYPYNSLQPNLDLGSTTLRFTNEALGLVNSRAYVNVSKSATGTLVFDPLQIKDETGQQVLVDVDRSVRIVIRRGSIGTGTSVFRANRMAGRSVIHEVTGYFAFLEVEVE